MKISMQEVSNLYSLYDKVKSQVLPVKTAYKFAKLFSSIKEEFDFYSSKVSEIITKYAELDERGKPVVLSNNTGVKIRPDQMAAANQALAELSTLEVDIPDYSITLEDFNDSSFLTVEELGYFAPFIKD